MQKVSNNKKSSFVLYHDIRRPLELLTDGERGQLFLSILDYSEYGTIPNLTGAAGMAFAFIRAALDRDTAAWEDKRKKRIDAGSRGGKQTAANRANANFAEQEQQTTANQAVPVPVSVSVPVSVPVIFEEDTTVSSCVEPETVSTLPVITLPLNDGTEYPISQELCQEWIGLYPVVDVHQQLRNMRGWLLSNTDRRKTRRGIKRFITGWLSREQDRGRNRAGYGAGNANGRAQAVPSDADYLEGWGDAL